ncbi:MAG TPA: MauE/DoxX family redox-associated membrane protein, partial [Puia sp.]|nr:MauE/DoxX family redox-associated membrane protein [Puia sp.]
MKKEYLVSIISGLFILLFVYAASSKLMEFHKFKLQVGQSPILMFFAGWIAWLIPALEIIISLMLMNRKTR